MSDFEKDSYWMQQALILANQAQAHNEVPVGAVLVLDKRMIGSGFNQSITRCDPTAHAEIIALREAANAIGNYRLLNTSLYVTLEPCVMCAGALVQARIKRLIYGASDPKTGAVKSIFKILNTDKLNHYIDCQGSILAAQCSQLLTNFFKQKRKNQ